MSTFIVSDKGFLKSITVDENHNKVFNWTDKVREAQIYKTTAATNLISTHNLSAFLWQPYKEEPILNQWDVCQRSDYYNFTHDETHKVLEWRVEKIVHESLTDLKFLQNRKSKNIKQYYNSEEEAKKAANHRNILMLTELQDKINEMQK